MNSSGEKQQSSLHRLYIFVLFISVQHCSTHEWCILKATIKSTHQNVSVSLETEIISVFFGKWHKINYDKFVIKLIRTYINKSRQWENCSCASKIESEVIRGTVTAEDIDEIRVCDLFFVDLQEPFRAVWASWPSPRGRVTGSVHVAGWIGNEAVVVTPYAVFPWMRIS